MSYSAPITGHLCWQKFYGSRTIRTRNLSYLTTLLSFQMCDMWGSCQQKTIKKELKLWSSSVTYFISIIQDNIVVKVKWRCQLRRLYSANCIWVIYGYWAVVEWYWQGKTKVFGGKPFPFPLILPQTPCGLAWSQIHASAARDGHLTSSAMVLCKNILRGWIWYIPSDSVKIQFI
jgi:hypothetical protein